MGAPLGNQNAVKKKLFDEALRREIKQRDLTDGDGETLRKIAAQWIDKAIAGDPALGKEVRDTLDGKPAQAIINGDDGPFQVETIKRLVIDPKASDA